MFNSIEELKAAVEDRRQAVLTLEVDISEEYSAEYEEAKRALAQARAMQTVFSGIGGSSLEELEAKVKATKPPVNSVWVQYRKLPLGEWAAMMKTVGGSQIEQYEKVLPKTFIGVYGQDPAPDEEDKPEGWVKPEPLSTDGALLSTKGDQGILPGGALNSVVQNFMAWQNSGGDVTIRPTKSGRD